MKTFFMIKPDGVRRNLIGEIISRVEAKGFVISKLKMMQIDKELAEEHYKEHSEKPFFNDLVSFITSGPVVAMQIEGENAVAQIRNLMGATNPKDADEGTIRKKYGISIDKNSVHGSDSVENAKKEIDFFFKD